MLSILIGLTLGVIVALVIIVFVLDSGSTGTVMLDLFPRLDGPPIQIER